MAALMQFQRESAYQKLLELILSGRLPEGQPLSERQIAADLGIGRTPVREAIKVLAKDGLLEVVPARGTYVARVSDEQLRELYEVRYALEGQAAELAARAGATPELLAYETLLDKSRSARSDREIGRAYETGADFHVDVFRCAGNSIMLELYLPIRNRFQATMRLGRYYDKASVIDAIEQHVEILEAIKDGDGPLARRRMVRHLKRSYASKKRILSSLQDKTLVTAVAAK